MKKPWKRRSNKDKLRYGERLRRNIREMRKHAPFAKAPFAKPKVVEKKLLEQVDENQESINK